MGTINIARAAEASYCIECIICGDIRERQEIRPNTNYKDMICDKCKDAILKVRTAIEAGRLDI